MVRAGGGLTAWLAVLYAVEGPGEAQDFERT